MKTPLLTVLFLAVAFPVRAEVRVGWHRSEPFLFEKIEGSDRVVTGLDAELMKTVSEKLRRPVTFVRQSWDHQLRSLKTGDLDVVLAAFKTPDRQRDYYLSIPYRVESTAMFMLHGEVDRYRYSDFEQLLEAVKRDRLRIGAIRGYAYASKAILKFKESPEGRRNIYYLSNYDELVSHILDGRIDAFFGDPIVVNTMTWKMNVLDRLEQHPLTVQKELHMMFSKVTFNKGDVRNFNAAINELRGNGSFGQINKSFVFPTLLARMLDSFWYKAMENIGIVAFAIAGLMIASRYKYDISGAFVMGSLPTIGGGVIRDLITNRLPIRLFDNPLYMQIILVTVVVGFLFLKALRYWGNKKNDPNFSPYNNPRFRKISFYVIETCDALGLATFAVTGVVVALATNLDPLWLWGPMLAFVGGSGGGILRDAVLSDPDFPTLKGELYGEIAIVWGALFSMFLIWQSNKIEPTELYTGTTLTVFGIFLTRMLVIAFELKSPKFY